jgi:hypothetical protein
MATDDVLGKADALLRRHSVAAPASGSDTGSVPVLTDTIDDPSHKVITVTDDIAKEVFARVLMQVEMHLSEELENRLAHQLTPQVQAAVAGAIAELRPALVKTIGDDIAEALARRPVK